MNDTLATTLAQPEDRAGDAGPAGAALLGSAAVVIWNDVAPEGRSEFYAWHDTEHIPERLAIPGFRRGRRYVRHGHSPEYLTLYEANGIDVVVSPEYLARLNAPTPGTVATLRHFRRTSRAVCRIAHSVGSSSGGHVLALRIEVAEAQRNAMQRCLRGAFDRALALTGVVACHLLAADQNASRVNTAESSTREFDIPSWVVLVEASIPAAAEHARALIENPEFLGLGAVVRADAAVYSLEICRLGAKER